MASINYATREISCKIVFYGPGLSGKTTNLQIIHRKIPDKDKSEMVSLATETDRTLFFDFLPLDLGTIKGFATKFQLYTVPGQVYYNATRKLVLRGVDGVVFVVDSQVEKMPENLESFANLVENLREYGHAIDSLPVVLQYNKRDLPNAYPVEQLNSIFNKNNLPYFEAVAATGVGVFTTLKGVGKLVIDRFNSKYAGFQGAGRRMQPGQTAATPPQRPAAPQAPSSAPAPQPMSPFSMPGMAPPFPGAAPGMPPALPQRPAGAFPPVQHNNPFMASPPSGPGFMPPPGAMPPGPKPFNPSAFPSGGGGFPPGPMQGFPAAQPGMPPLPGGRPPFPGQPMGGAPMAPVSGNIPASPFLENYGTKPPPGAQSLPPIQGLQSSNPFNQQPIPPAGQPSQGLPANPQDNSGIVSSYEDQRDENIKTKKIPLPSEKKKGFFDGLFKK